MPMTEEQALAGGESAFKPTPSPTGGLMTPSTYLDLMVDPDASMYAAPVEQQYQPGGASYVPPYDPGAQYGMGASGGDPAVAWAQSQPTDPYNTAPSGAYPSDTPQGNPYAAYPASGYFEDNGAYTPLANGRGNRTYTALGQLGDTSFRPGPNPYASDPLGAGNILATSNDGLYWDELLHPQLPKPEPYRNADGRMALGAGDAMFIPGGIGGSAAGSLADDVALAMARAERRNVPGALVKGGIRRAPTRTAPTMGEAPGVVRGAMSQQPPVSRLPAGAVRVPQQPSLTSGTTPASRTIPGVSPMPGTTPASRTIPGTTYVSNAIPGTSAGRANIPTNGTSPFPRTPNPTASVIDAIPSYLKPGLALAGAAGVASLASPRLSELGGQANDWIATTTGSDGASVSNPQQVYSGDQPYYGPRFRDEPPASLPMPDPSMLQTLPSYDNARGRRGVETLRTTMPTINPYAPKSANTSESPAQNTSTQSPLRPIPNQTRATTQIVTIDDNGRPAVQGYEASGRQPQGAVAVTEAMIDALIAGGVKINRDTAMQTLLGQRAVLPPEWMALIGEAPAETAESTAPSTENPYTAQSTTSSSSGGGGSGKEWVDYGKSYGGRSGSGYARGYDGYDGYGASDGGFSPETVFAQNEGEGTEESMWDNPIFARYFAVLEARYGREGAMRRMRGLSRRFRFGNRMSRSMKPTSRSKTRSRSVTSESSGGVPTNEGIRKDVTKRVKKATK